MTHNYGLDYETGYDMYRDPQMRTAEEGDGICLWCGGVYPLSELERNEGMCLTCYYASLEPAPEDGELFEGEARETDSSTSLRSAQNDSEGRAGRLPALQETEGGGGDAGKRKKL